MVPTQIRGGRICHEALSGPLVRRVAEADPPVPDGPAVLFRKGFYRIRVAVSDLGGVLPGAAELRPQQRHQLCVHDFPAGRVLDGHADGRVLFQPDHRGVRRAQRGLYLHPALLGGHC